jgi:hypothetical protein
MRPEYDFTGVPGVRGKHAAAMRQGYTCTVHHPDGTREITHVRPLEGSIVLDPDVQAYFPDAEAVNTALRGLIALRTAGQGLRSRPSAAAPAQRRPPDGARALPGGQTAGGAQERTDRMDDTDRA